MKLLCSPTSPYSAKVRMAVVSLGIEHEQVFVDTTADPDLLVSSNPLGKIPALVTESDGTVFDSRAIMQYLHREHGKALFPAARAKRTQAEVTEALCDGTCDCLLAIVYEMRMRPEEKRHQPWIDRQWSKVERSLSALEERLPTLAGKLHAGHFATGALIGYLELRFAGRWEKAHPKLSRWAKRFATRFPDYQRLKPQQP